MTPETIVERYRAGTLPEEDKAIIDELFRCSVFRRGQISILHPEHWEAFDILFHDLDKGIKELKELREKGQR